MAAGFLHTLAGADHLAALTPLTVGRHPVASSALGALWGAGHCTGQLILGLCMVLLKERFDQVLPFQGPWLRWEAVSRAAGCPVDDRFHSHT